MRPHLGGALALAAASACVCDPGNLTQSSTLPNLLIVGDSIASPGTGYFDYLPELVGGLAHVVHSGNVSDEGALEDIDGDHSVDELNLGHKGPCGTSYGVLECVDVWLGNLTWDVISFNWGLHDICPKMYANVSKHEYDANLRAILAKLQGGLAPNGTVVWASTTPVPASYANRNNSDVIAINARGGVRAIAAQAVADSDAVFGADLYTEVVARCDRNQTWAGYPETNDCLYLQDNGVHFSELGKRFTGLGVAAHVMRYL